MSKRAVARRLKTSSLTRLFILYPAHAASAVGRPRVIRWIGASARAGHRSPPGTSGIDNVTILSWAETFGRPVRRDCVTDTAPATVLPLTPRPVPARQDARTDARAYR